MHFIKISFCSYSLFGQVDIIGDQNFDINVDGSLASLPLFSNQSIYTLPDDITRAVIVIHGQNRNADDYYNSIYSAAFSTEELTETLVIAPQFLTTTDINFWELSNSVVFWSNTTSWTGGNLSNSTSDHPRDYDISSFSIMDSLVSYLLHNVPYLEKVIIVGNSAGGQFVNRYAAGSDQNGQGKIEYIISAPSHFLYLDENRLEDYTRPFVWITPDGCSNYNDYRYGLYDLNNYMSLTGVDSIKARYSRRKIKYLIGGEDVYGTTDCSSMAQGDNRFLRSIIYYNYMQFIYGPGIRNNQKIAVVPDLAHNHDTMFNSDCGKYAIFGSGDCEQLEDPLPPDAQFLVNVNSGNYPMEVTFIDQSIDGTFSIEQLLWSIDSETVASNNSIQYTFDQPGSYDVELIAMDLMGMTDTVHYPSLILIDTLYGDVNWDASVTQSDAEMILDYSCGDNILDNLQQASGDVSTNGILTSFDAALIYKYLSGQINQLPFYDGEEQNASGLLYADQAISGDGQIVTIPVYLTSPDNVLSFDISMSYDPSQLSFGTINSSSLSEQGFNLKSSFQNGHMVVSGAGSLPVNNDILLFNLYFIVSYSESDQITLRSNNIVFNESNSMQEFSVSITDNLKVDKPIGPENFHIVSNYPNPFNASTLVKYILPASGKVQASIVDIRGQLVKSLFNDIQESGEKAIRWNGFNDKGKKVPSGIYFFTIQNNAKRHIKKVTYVQ